VKKLIVALVCIVFCGGCYIPHPSNRAGVRTLRPVEGWEKVCTIQTQQDGTKVNRCRWVRLR
jgi:hypothetical protein